MCVEKTIEEAPAHADRVWSAEVEAAAGALEMAVLVLRGLNDPREARSVAALSSLMEAWSRRAAERSARAELGADATTDEVREAAARWRDELQAAVSNAERPGLEGRVTGALRGMSPQSRVVRARSLILAILGTLESDLDGEGHDIARGAVAMLSEDLGRQMDMIATDIANVRAWMREADDDREPGQGMAAG